MGGGGAFQELGLAEYSGFTVYDLIIIYRSRPLALCEHIVTSPPSFDPLRVSLLRYRF